MSYDVTKTNHLPMRVLFGTAGAEVELGYTAPGEITVTFNEEWVQQTAHQTGNRVIEAYSNPGNPTIQVGLMELKNTSGSNTLSNWAIAFPLGSAQSDGGTGYRFSPTLITDGASTSHVGKKASSIAKRLILRPVDSTSSSSETEHDLWFPKAYVQSVGEIQFGVETPFVLNLTFGTLFTDAASEGEHLWLLGKPTGSWVDA